MKIQYKTSILILLMTTSIFSAKAQIGFGTNTPNTSAVVDMAATDKGMLIPRMTSAQRDAITSPTIGLQIYNTDENCIQFYKNSTDLWFNVCDGTISAPGVISFLYCSSAELVGPVLFYPGTVPANYRINIPYDGGNAGFYNAQSIASSGVTGLTLTLPAGNFKNGSGSLQFSLTGSPSASGTASFNISIGGKSCSVSVNVKNGSTASNCETMIGQNIPTLPLSTSINLNGKQVIVSKVVVGTLAPIGGLAASHCGATLLNDGGPVRLGATAAGITSIKLIFSKPVNDVTIVSNWYFTNDAHKITTNSGGTITATNILSDCPVGFAIMGNGTSTVEVKCTSGANNKGLTYLVRATEPYTEITISKGSTNYDDIIAAFALCDAYVVE